LLVSVRCLLHRWLVEPRWRADPRQVLGPCCASAA